MMKSIILLFFTFFIFLHAEIIQSREVTMTEKPSAQPTLMANKTDESGQVNVTPNKNTQNTPIEKLDEDCNGTNDNAQYIAECNVNRYEREKQQLNDLIVKINNNFLDSKDANDTQLLFNQYVDRFCSEDLSMGSYQARLYAEVTEANCKIDHIQFRIKYLERHYCHDDNMCPAQKPDAKW